MNAKYVLAVLATITVPCAFAQAAPPSPSNVAQYQAAAATPLTRAQVTAELYRARANGEICGNEAECGAAPLRVSTAKGQPAPAAAGNVHICRNEAECDAAPHRDFTVTRAQVTAELYRARAAGEIAETEADNDIGRSALRRHAK